MKRYMSLMIAAVAAVSAACGDDGPTGPIGPTEPPALTLTVSPAFFAAYGSGAKCAALRASPSLPVRFRAKDM